MTTMSRSRLLKLADLLDTLPTAKFDLGQWHNGKSNCETVACAFGWATTIPEFRSEGLELQRNRWPKFRRFIGFRAAEEFFDLTEPQARFLFSPDEYPSGNRTRPKTVAKRIRKLVEVS